MNNGCRVAIGIATYKRPKLLSGLLESLKAIDFDRIEPFLIVVDNDPEQTAHAVVDLYSKNLPFDCHYLVETTRGIASARNTIIEEANRQRADFLAFVDDDETVTQRWCAELVDVAQSTTADAVMGRVVFVFDSDVPEWIKSGNLLAFPRAELQTGEPVRCRDTANLLLRMKSLNGLGLRFDERFNLTGGSDAQFLQRFESAGRIIIAANDAVTFERIGFTRSRLSWFVKRSYRYGIGHAMAASQLSPVTSQLAAIGKAFLLGARSVLCAIPAFIREGRAGALNQLWLLSYSIGRILGSIGVRYRAYHTIHGQ